MPVPSAGQSGSARPSSTPPVIRVPSSGGRYSMAGFKPTRPVCHPIDRAARRQKCARSQNTISRTLLTQLDTRRPVELRGCTVEPTSGVSGT